MASLQIVGLWTWSFLFKHVEDENISWEHFLWTHKLFAEWCSCTSWKMSFTYGWSIYLFIYYYLKKAIVLNCFAKAHSSKCPWAHLLKRLLPQLFDDCNHNLSETLRNNICHNLMMVICDRCRWNQKKQLHIGSLCWASNLLIWSG